MGDEWIPQSAGDNVGEKLSNEEPATPPNSEAYVPHHDGPMATLGPSDGGMFGEKSSKLPGEFTVAKPEPCWYLHGRNTRCGAHHRILTAATRTLACTRVSTHGPCVSMEYFGGVGGGTGGNV